MDIKMLDHLRKMNFDLSGPSILTSLSSKLLVEVGKIYQLTEALCYLDSCGLFFGLSSLCVSLSGLSEAIGATCCPYPCAHSCCPHLCAHSCLLYRELEREPLSPAVFQMPGTGEAPNQWGLIEPGSWECAMGHVGIPFSAVNIPCQSRT